MTDSVVTALHWKTQRKVKVNLDRVYPYTGRINKRMKLLKDSQRGIESNIQAENECPATERSISEIDQLSDNMGEDPEVSQSDYLTEEDRREEETRSKKTSEIKGSSRKNETLMMLALFLDSYDLI